MRKTGADIQSIQREAFAKVQHLLVFDYETRPGVAMAWDQRLRGIIERFRPDAWVKYHHNLVQLVTVTKTEQGEWSATGHQVGSTSFWTNPREYISEGSAAQAFELAVSELFFLDIRGLQRFPAPDIDACWLGLVEVWVGPHPKHAIAGRMQVKDMPEPIPLEDFAYFHSSVAVGGTLERSASCDFRPVRLVRNIQIVL